MHLRYEPVCLLVILVLGGLIPGATRGDDDKKKKTVIAATEARNHVGEECTATMTVKSSKNAAPRRTYFLDSEEDFRDEKNLAVIISYDHADKFREAGIADPAEYYQGKTIEVTGKVIAEEEQIRIHVEDPKQIKVVSSDSY